MSSGSTVIVTALGSAVTASLLTGLIRRRNRHRDPSLSPGLRALRAVIVTLYVLLAPVFGFVMYSTVTKVVRASFGWQAPAAPLATEGAFAILFLLSIFMQLVAKPMGWLKWAPYPFTVVSLLLNVWAYWGDLVGIVGHAAVTAAFFVPVIAGEEAIRKMSVSEEAVRLRTELAAACLYARDLLRDREGIAWRFKVPSLLRTQVTAGRLPASVMAAVSDGPSAWEPAVRKLVVDGLVAGAWMAAEEAVTRRQIEESAKPSPEPVTEPESAPAPQRQPKPRKPVSEAVTKAARDGQIRAMLTGSPGKPAMTVKAVAAAMGVSESTVERVKRDMPTPLSSARSARG